MEGTVDACRERKVGRVRATTRWTVTTPDPATRESYAQVNRGIGFPSKELNV